MPDYKKQNKYLWIFSISAVVLFIVSVIFALFTIFSKQEPAGKVSFYLDPDSSSATFSKNNQADVKVMIKNLTNETLSLGTYQIVMEAPSNSVDVKVNMGFSPVDGWSWAPNTGFSNNKITLIGASPNYFQLAPNSVLQVATIQLTPKNNFQIIFKKESCIIFNKDLIDVFDRKNTPNSQSFNIK